MRSHEGRGYPCEFCGKVLSSEQRKQYHESTHTGLYRFICDMCDKGFNDKNKYEQHRVEHE